MDMNGVFRSLNWNRARPYALIVLLCLLCHGLLLTSDATVWDGWFLLNWLSTHNWATMHEFFSAVGIPLYAWLYRPFALAPNIIFSIMLATFLCLLACGIMTYKLVLRLTTLSRDEALLIALFTVCMPFFTAAQDIIMFFFIFTHTLFQLGALLATYAMESAGWRRILLRVVAVICFYFSFTSAALIVFYGCFYILFFLLFKRLKGVALIPAATRFVVQYPDFLLLPPFTWATRFIVTPQYGWYEHYNMPGANLKRLPENFFSFFKNAVPYHFQSSFAWIMEHPFLSCGMMTAVILWYAYAPARWSIHSSKVSSLHFIWFGILSLFLAVFPYAAAGKYFLWESTSENSHHLILTGMPLAVLLTGLLRLIFPSGKEAMRKLMPPVCGCIIIILTGQIVPVYINEQADWICNQSILHNAVKSPVIRDSSVILFQGSRLVEENAYGLYGFASAFGEVSHLATARIPLNKSFYTPSEIETTLLGTTLLPDDFKHINPAGRQIWLEASRNPGDADGWGLVSHYLRLRHFGTKQELDEFITSLVTLSVTELKPPTPLPVAQALPDPPPPPNGPPTGNFTNGIGMQMIRLPAGFWVDKFETTQAEYERLGMKNPSLFKDPRRPVECVSWDEATEFCTRLTDAEAKAGRLPSGYVYRLPTIKEFDLFKADSSPSDEVTSFQQIRWHTEPVGSMPPNRFGLYDTQGNVWEWCYDWWDDKHRFKVSKGASWAVRPWELTPIFNPRDDLDVYSLAYIDRLFGPMRRDYPSQGFWDRGFRCVLASPNPESIPVTHAQHK